MPAWQQALTALHLPLYDVHWDAAVVLDKGGGKRGDGLIKVGLADGRVMPLTGAFGQIGRKLSIYDVIYVHVVDTKPAKGKSAGGQAQLRVRPGVQGAALVIENKTGRILAMAGSFSYPLSQLNRAVQTARQPGSAMKPLTYLTALEKGLQPNTLVSDEPLTLPPVGAGGRYVIARDQGGFARPEDFWTPRNADNSSGGLYTMRRGLENSVNMVTAHLLQGGIDRDPVQSLDDVCATAVAAKIYTDCIRYYPFVLGAQPVHMIDLAAFYAAVANEGARPQPHGIDSIEVGGRTVYEYPKTPLPFIGAADRTSFYQLKTMLQGVVARGTARAIGALSPYVAGKTGTTEDAVDGWFVGFTNDVTVAVWVGYDNGDGKRRSLGTNATGARVALPIFQPILEAVWADGIAPKAPLNGPSHEAQLHLIDLPIDYASGNRIAGGGRGSFIEHFHLGADGRFNETQYQLIPQEDASGSALASGSAQESQGGSQPRSQGYWASAPREDDRFVNGRSFYPGQGPQPNYPGQPPPPNYPGQGPQSRGAQPMARGFFGSFWDGRAN
jgi:penicillin-binding protein 1A